MIYVINVLLILALFEFGKKLKNGKMLALFMSFLIMTAIIVLRGAVGTDYNTYNSIYQNIVRKQFLISIQTEGIEVGYVILCYICNWISPNNPWLVHFFMGFLTMTFYYLTVKKFSTDLFLTTYLFVSMGFMYRIMNQERQELAIAIGLYGSMFLKSRSKWRFLFFVLLASVFHTSAWVFLILLIPDIFKIFRQRRLLLMVFTILIIYVLLNIRGILPRLGFGMARYLWYFSKNGQFQINQIIHAIVRTLIIIFICIPVRKVLYRYPVYGVFYFMTFLLLIFQIATLFSSVFGRVLSYFYPSLILLIPAATRCLSVKENKKTLIYLSIFLISTIYHCFYFSLASRSVGMYPYIFFWQ